MEGFCDGVGEMPDSLDGSSVNPHLLPTSTPLNWALQLGVVLTPLLMDQHRVALTLLLHGLA